MNDVKDDHDMEAVLNKDPKDAEKRKARAAAAKSLITRNLRLAYGEVASEGVPQRFLDLLNQIGEREEQQS
jgi:hypothetical protein